MGNVIWIAEVFKFTSGCSWAVLPATGKFQAIWYSLLSEPVSLLHDHCCYSTLSGYPQRLGTVQFPLKTAPVFNLFAFQNGNTRNTRNEMYLRDILRTCPGSLTWPACLPGCGNFHRERNVSPTTSATPILKHFTGEYLAKPGRHSQTQSDSS